MGEVRRKRHSVLKVQVSLELRRHFVTNMKKECQLKKTDMTLSTILPITTKRKRQKSFFSILIRFSIEQKKDFFYFHRAICVNFILSVVSFYGCAAVAVKNLNVVGLLFDFE